MSKVNYTLLWHYSVSGARNFSQTNEIVTFLTTYLHPIFQPPGSIVNHRGLTL